MKRLPRLVRCALIPLCVVLFVVFAVAWLSESGGRLRITQSGRALGAGDTSQMAFDWRIPAAGQDPSLIPGLSIDRNFLGFGGHFAEGRENCPPVACSSLAS